MCLSPILIKNPYYHLGKVGINAFHDTVNTHIKVPCGSCAQCSSMRQSFYLQRVQMESLRSHIFFFTLTYNDESLVFAEAGDYSLAIPVLSDVQSMFKRLRAKGHCFRYSYVSEYGSRRHRPHFHGLLAVDKSQGDFRYVEKKFSQLLLHEWRRNYAMCLDKHGNPKVNTRCPEYRPLSTPVYKHARNTTFDFHYVEPIIDHDNDVAFYVSKYITKYDSWTDSLMKKIKLDPSLSCDETVFLLDKLKPRCNTSKDFGDWKDSIIWQYIIKCASRQSLFRYPQFYDIVTGKQMPMSPYYGKRIPGFEHCYERLLASDYSDQMSTNFEAPSTRVELCQESFHKLQQFEEFQKKLRKLENRLLD